MAANVLASWAGHLVFIASGFVMPRLIDGKIGQEALGVWDFAWSLISYFALVQGGVVSSVNRFVASYRAANDVDGVNRAVSTVTVIFAVMGAIVIGLTLGAASLLTPVFGERLGEHLSDARWVVLLLGASLAIQIALSGFGGVMTGCHRWGLHNAIYAGSHAVSVSGMIVALMLGFGLPGMALMTLTGDASGRVLRCVLAYRVAPGLKVRPSNFRWSEARQMLAFGGKSFVTNIANLLLNQTINILILAYLGPASLALFARPMALIRHMRTMLDKFANVLIPTASAYQAAADESELRDLLIRGSRYAAYIALPMVLVLAIMGGPILQVWMGERYAQGPVLAILALGYLGLLSQVGTQAVMTGLNAHGRPALANFVAAVCAAGLAAVALGVLEWGLIGAALSAAIPLSAANGVYLPLYACRRLSMSMREYLNQTWRTPLSCCAPFGACLILARLMLADQPWLCLATGCIGGGVMLAGLYWRYALPESLKERVYGTINRRRSRPLNVPHA